MALTEHAHVKDSIVHPPPKTPHQITYPDLLQEPKTDNGEGTQLSLKSM